MTLYETINLLNDIALKHPNINSVGEGNIYDYMNTNPSIKYGVFFITQGSHSQDDMFNHFEFTLFYVDRLLSDMENNRLQIQSIGKEMLSNIINFFCEEFDGECENIRFQPFTQKFADETAGVYATIIIDIPKDIICPEEYWEESWYTPITVIRNQDKSVVFTENGTYIIDYDPTIYTGLGTVTVDVNIDTDSYYESGYTEGYDKGNTDGYADGYEIGNEEGYANGKTDGIAEGYADGYEIGNTEGYANGKTDGYNEGYEEGFAVSYDEGYNKGQEDIAANARVLDVTENGVYVSKFTQDSDYEMPYEETGDDFWSYATLTNQAYNTNITVTQDSVIELWYKGDNEKTNDGWNTIFGCLDGDDTNFYLGYRPSYNNNLRGFLGEKEIQFSWDDTVWHHIIMKNDGLWIDDVLIGSFNSTKTFASILDINGTWDWWGRNANGCFGMIKIDDVVIIPTADGFLNTSTNELLEIVKEGSYVFTEIQRPIAEGELYKTITVNVPPKISVKDTGLKFGNSTFKEVPEWADFEGATDLSNMFNDCTLLQTIPLIDTSNVTNMSEMFNDCSNLQTIPIIDTSNATNMYRMFGSCNNLQTIPQIDTSNVTDISRMFYSCNNLVSLPKFDCTKVTNIDRHLYGTKNNLTDVGGWENLSCNWNDNYGLVTCPNLTYQSCINVLNGLYDFIGNGSTETRTLKVHANFLTTVGDEISIGTNKGWTITN